MHRELPVHQPMAEAEVSQALSVTGPSIWGQYQNISNCEVPVPRHRALFACIVLFHIHISNSAFRLHGDSLLYACRTHAS